MSKHARDRRPYLKPVTKLELSESNIKLRWIAIAVLLAIAAVSIGYGFYAALSTEPGWQEVTVLSDEVNCSGDFKLMYDFGADGINPTAQYKKLETLYGELTVSAYRLFSPDAEGTDNLYHLNTHVNETVTVHPALYAALEQIAVSGSRHPFMGPVKELYDPVFLSSADGEAALFDPMKDPELAQLARDTAFYCADPGMISLELLGENQVCLKVSEEYVAFAEEYGFETLLDLGWMTNAFVIDYIANSLAAEGYTFGYLSSYDGFTRNLDNRGNSYSINFFNRQRDTILMPASLAYSEPVSIVFLRDYPLTGRDQWHYYSYADGSITTALLDPADGTSKSAVDSLMGYSASYGCGQILLELAPVFTADLLNTDVLLDLSNKGIESLWYEGDVLCHTEEDAAVTLLRDSGGEGYSIRSAK